MRRFFMLIGVVMGLLLVNAVALAQQEQIHTGYMGNDVPDDFYSVRIEAGQGIIAAAETTSGDLDPYLFLYDADDAEVASNDDRDTSTLDSLLLYVAEQAGEYTLVMTNISGTSGDYRLTISVVSAEEVYAQFDAQRPQLSGPAQTVDSTHFRVHYTTEGFDAADPAFVQQVSDVFEQIYIVQIQTMGWPAPPDDGVVGGDGRFDVYLVELDTPELSEYGSTSPERVIGDNPSTPAVEQFAVTSYMTMDNDYNFADVEDPIALMQATAAHEFHHAIQFGYDETDDNWYYEATASYMETVTLPGIEAATPYVVDVYTYPEVCIGADGDADPAGGLLMYGHWLFIETMVTAYGPQILPELWANVAIEEGWRGLEVTLNAYDDTIEQAFARYHLINLVRDYKLAPTFGDDVRVWIESVIEGPGTWTYSGSGIQELAANYFEIILPPGVYAVDLVHDGTEVSAALNLWAIGVKGNQAAAFDLGISGAIDTSDWDAMYLMVFNPVYDADLSECVYTDYSITVAAGAKSTPVEPVFALNAANFIAGN